MALKTIFRAKTWAWLPLLLLTSCCANNVCDCVGEAREDAVLLVFDQSATGFTAADLDTVVIQRYPKIIKPNVKPDVKPDVVTIVRTASQANVPDTITLNNTTPFPQQGSTKLNGYSYRVRFLSHTGPRPNAALALTIDSVQLRGSLEGNGCCTCYTNSYKALYVREPDSVTRALVELPKKDVYVIRK
ncbi:MAG: hypothetical protein M3Y54_00690 [Bacteroidota bacterium]|nr:hypothetical protein [Bacteroidota bacterium]